MSRLGENRKDTGRSDDVPSTDTECPVIEGSFVEGLFVPADVPSDEDAAVREDERLDEIGNASIPPGGTYS
jgi:hypothetical protein